MIKLDISSTTAEKAVDAARSFVSSLIKPGIDEVGLLLRDKVMSWRFNNQVRTLVKAQEFCKAKGIEPKNISFKLLCPLLEYASLEEDEEMQDNWARLLSNLVDSKQNIQNHVFPYILSQLSKSEYLALKTIVDRKQDRVHKANDELSSFDSINEPRLSQLPQLIQAAKELELNTKAFDSKRTRTWYDLKHEHETLLNQRLTILHKLNNEETVAEDLHEFEYSNLLRLGVIKIVITTPEVYTEPIEIPSPHEYIGRVNYVDVKVEIDGISTDFILSELGELFIKACSEV